jgi:hypothetical protein
MLVRFIKHLIVDRHNHVPGDVVTLEDERARRLIREGAVEPHVPPARREAVAVPKTRKAVQEV